MMEVIHEIYDLHQQQVERFTSSSSLDELKAFFDVKGSKDSAQAAYTAQRTRDSHDGLVTDWALDSVYVVTSKEKIHVVKSSQNHDHDDAPSDMIESYWQGAIVAVRNEFRSVLHEADLTPFLGSHWISNRLCWCFFAWAIFSIPAISRFSGKSRKGGDHSDNIGLIFQFS